MHWLIVLALTLLAFVLRLRWLGDLVIDDPPYHLVRIARLLNGWVSPTAIDVLVAQPHGAIAHCPWGFAWLLALIAKPFVALPVEPGALILVVSIACAAFGAALVPLAFLLGRAVNGCIPVGVAAAALVAILPGHFDYSIAPRVDHHVLEPVFIALWCLGALSDRTGARVAGGFIAGVSLAFVPSALPMVAIGVAVFGLPTFAIGAAIGAFGALTASPFPTAWVFYSPSLLHASLLTLLALGIVAKERAKWRPTLVGALTIVVPTLLAIAFIAPIRHAFVDGVKFLHGTATLPLTIESQPLYRSLTLTSDLLTWLWPLALLGVVTLAVRRHPATLVVLAALILAALQLRFVMPAAALYCAAVGVGGAALKRRVVAWSDAKKLKRSVVYAFLATLAIAAIAPTAEYLIEIQPWTAADRLAQRTANELATAPRAPGDGVLAPWDLGHLLQWSANLPTVCDNFFGAPAHDAAIQDCLALMYQHDSDAAIFAALHNYRIRYIVMRPPSVEQIAIDATVGGFDASRYLTSTGGFQRAFFATLWGRLAAFAVEARESDRGPFGLTLYKKRTLLSPTTGKALATLWVFRVP